MSLSDFQGAPSKVPLSRAQFTQLPTTAYPSSIGPSHLGQERMTELSETRPTERVAPGGNVSPIQGQDCPVNHQAVESTALANPGFYATLMPDVPQALLS